MRFTLATGREISIIEAHFRWTYEGILLGAPRVSENRERLDSANTTAAEAYPGYNVALVYPGNWEAELLPPHYWTLELRSDGVSGTRDIWSALVVVWFTEYDDARPLLAQAAAGLQNLRWDRFAKGWEP